MTTMNLIWTEPRYTAGRGAMTIAAHARSIASRADLIREHLTQQHAVDWDTLYLDGAALELTLETLATTLAELRATINRQLTPIEAVEAVEPEPVTAR